MSCNVAPAAEQRPVAGLIVHVEVPLLELAMLPELDEVVFEFELVPVPPLLLLDVVAVVAPESGLAVVPEEHPAVQAEAQTPAATTETRPIVPVIREVNCRISPTPIDRRHLIHARRSACPRYSSEAPRTAFVKANRGQN